MLFLSTTRTNNKVEIVVEIVCKKNEVLIYKCIVKTDNDNKIISTKMKIDMKNCVNENKKSEIKVC